MKPKPKPKPITHADIDALNLKLNGNVTKSKCIAQAFRNLNGKNNVQPYYRETKALMRKETAEFFDIRKFVMETKKGKSNVYVEKYGCVTKKAKDYLESIRMFRNIPVKDCHKKVGLDKGQESLKMTGSVLNKATNVASTSSTLFKKDLKYTGAYMSIIGIVSILGSDFCKYWTI